MEGGVQVSRSTVACKGSDIFFFLCLNDRGGAELSMLRLARGLAASGLGITIVTYGTHGNLAEAYAPGCEFIHLPAKRTLKAFSKLYRLLKMQQPDILVTALTHTNIVAQLAALTARSGTKVVLTEHGQENIEEIFGRDDFAARMLAKILRYTYARADRVISVSQGLAKLLESNLPDLSRVQVIYNPVVSEANTAAQEPPHPWLKKGEPPVIVAVGRLREEKNFRLLIRAFARVAGRRPARLMILGEGSERKHLEKMVAEFNLRDSVLLPGFVSTVQPWLQHAAVFVSASKREGFGNAIVEAMMAGVPVVATDCPYGPAEILEQGRYGKLVPSQDIIALANAIEEVLINRPNVDPAQARAREFSDSRCIDAYRALFNEWLDVPVKTAP